jgi:regulation of enolase protein 1 (concanavalin A-like superfamily)
VLDLTRRAAPRILCALAFILIFFSSSVAAGAGESPSAAQQFVPPPWLDADIGAPGLAGSSSESGGTFAVKGAGADIWGTADQFHFVYQTLSGDLDVRAQVVGLQNVRAATKGGVMIRESLAANAPHGAMFASSLNGLAFHRRASPGAITTSTEGGASTVPVWVRLTRAGNLFCSYVSLDGAIWTLVGTETIPMAPSVYVGLAVTSHTNTKLATVSFADVSLQEVAPAAASPWVRRDIGSPALAGRSSDAAGTFSVTGAGVDIWGRADQFHFVYQPVDGDLEITARVATVQRAHAWSKAGVMIRGALTGGAAQASMFGSAAKGWAFHRRLVEGGLSLSSPGDLTAVPGWVRLVRNGDDFSAYASTDGNTWTLIGTETIVMPIRVFVGLAGTSHNASLTSTATLDDLTIAQTSVANVPPTISVTSPLSGASYTAPASITVDATAADADGTISSVEFFANGQAIGSDSSAPYTVTWTSAAAGTYTITARATDNQGAVTTSSGVAVTVNPAANVAPTVSISSPTTGATYTAPGSIAITASAADSDGTVSLVEFYRDTTLIGSDTMSPYTFTWSGAAAGTYSLTARATDNAGGMRTSTAVSVTVNPAAPQQTTVIFVASTDHNTNVDSYSVKILRASDPPTGTPVATTGLGKPVVVNNEISVNISSTIDPLAAGSYYAVVTAINTGGSTAGTQSANFTK